MKIAPTYVFESTWCQESIGVICSTNKWRAASLQATLGFGNCEPPLKRSTFKCISSWLNCSFFWWWTSGFYERGSYYLSNGTNVASDTDYQQHLYRSNRGQFIRSGLFYWRIWQIFYIVYTYIFLDLWRFMQKISADIVEIKFNVKCALRLRCTRNVRKGSSILWMWSFQLEASHCDSQEIRLHITKYSPHDQVYEPSKILMLCFEIKLTSFWSAWPPRIDGIRRGSQPKRRCCSWDRLHRLRQQTRRAWSWPRESCFPRRPSCIVCIPENSVCYGSSSHRIPRHVGLIIQSVVYLVHVPCSRLQTWPRDRSVRCWARPLWLRGASLSWRLRPAAGWWADRRQSWPWWKLFSCQIVLPAAAVLLATVSVAHLPTTRCKLVHSLHTQRI